MIAYFTFGQVSPDFDMLRQPIGRLELMRYGWIQSANFIVFGIFISALLLAYDWSYAKLLLPWSQAFIAFGMILLGIFIHEPAHTFAFKTSVIATTIAVSAVEVCGRAGQAGPVYPA